MFRNNQFATEIRTIFENKHYIKVFFLDDTVASQAKTYIETLNCVKNVNITESQHQAHMGNTLTVYPKPMVTIEYCEKEITNTLNVFFGNVGNMQAHSVAYFASIESRILEALDNAQATVDVCVAWFTNERLKNKLVEKKNDGVEVRVIIFDDGVNQRNGVDLSDLNHKKCRGERGGFMHEKFCVIDNVTTIHGSYNWTSNAEHKNDEEVAFRVEDYVFSSKYTRHFNQIWRRDIK